MMYEPIRDVVHTGKEVITLTRAVKRRQRERYLKAKAQMPRPIEPARPPGPILVPDDIEPEADKQAVPEASEKPAKKEPTVYLTKSQQITQAARQAFGLTMAELTAPRRNKHLVRIRWACALLMRRHCLLSFPQIARILGRDHSSICYGIDMMDKSSELKILYVKPILGKLGWQNEGQDA